MESIAATGARMAANWPAKRRDRNARTVEAIKGASVIGLADSGVAP